MVEICGWNDERRLIKNSDDIHIKRKLEAYHIAHWIGQTALDSDDRAWHALRQKESTLGLGMETAYENICNQSNHAAQFDTEEKIHSMGMPHSQA